MKTQLTIGMIVIVVLTTLLALAVAPGQSLAQGIAPESPAAVAPGAMPIQGKLTNASGVPLTGTYTVTFALYDAATGGTKVCEDVVSVTTTNGLFSSYMDHCYNGKLTGQKVWLGVTVAGDPEMTPRQVIFPVAYALGLVPGVVVEAANATVMSLSTSNASGTALNAAATSATGSNYAIQASSASSSGTALSAAATSATGSNYGIQASSASSSGTALSASATAASGINYGVLASSASSSGYAGYFTNSSGGTGLLATSVGGTGVFAGSLATGLVASGGTTAISAEGSGIIMSTAKSYVWISGNEVRPNSTVDPTRIDLDSIGGARVYPGAPGVVRNVMLPITITGPLYGQDVRITDLDIYWKANDGFEGITAVVMHRQIAVCESETVPPTCFATLLNAHPVGLSCDDSVSSKGCTLHYDLTTNNVLSASSGILYLTLELTYGNNTWIQIGGVKLTLEHD